MRTHKHEGHYLRADLEIPHVALAAFERIRIGCPQTDMHKDNVQKDNRTVSETGGYLDFCVSEVKQNGTDETVDFRQPRKTKSIKRLKTKKLAGGHTYLPSSSLAFSS